MASVDDLKSGGKEIEEYERLRVEKIVEYERLKVDKNEESETKSKEG